VRVLITGVLTTRSIAFAVASRAQEEGAEVLLTSFGRARDITARAAARLPRPADVLELDVNSSDDLAAVQQEVSRRWGGLDALLHSVAYAPPDALNGRFLETPRESAELAFATSAYSLKALTAAMLPSFRDAGGGSVVGLDLDASRAWPRYDWMGVSKAALEAVARYLAGYVAADGVRVNLVSPGLLSTPSSSAFDEFREHAETWAERAPLEWDIDDPWPVADAIMFLFSSAARGITGEIIHVDGGAHSVEGMPPALVATEAR
jgi:meromycolic acid enoyl-[acyl-carrier-protein] reductase